MESTGFVSRFLKPCAVVAFMTALAACGSSGEPARMTTSVTVTSPSLTPKQGDAVQLTAVAWDRFGDVMPATMATWS